MPKQTRQEVICKICGYKWRPISVHPRACTKCKSYLWDTGPKHKKIIIRQDVIDVMETAGLQDCISSEMAESIRDHANYFRAHAERLVP